MPDAEIQTASFRGVVALFSVGTSSFLVEALGGVRLKPLKERVI